MTLGHLLVLLACLAVTALAAFGTFCLWRTHDADLQRMAAERHERGCGGHPALCDHGGCAYCTPTTPPTTPRSAA